MSKCSNHATKITLPEAMGPTKKSGVLVKMKFTFNQSHPRSQISLGIAVLMATHATFAAAVEPPIITMIDGQAVSPPVSGTAIPLSWNDPVFASAVSSSSRLSLASGETRSNLSIVEQSGEPTITCNGSCTLDHIRLTSREGYRCVSGNQNLLWMWIEATGTGTDHADGIQCYSPGSTGTLTVKNTTIKVSGEMNAAYFSADNWQGSHVLENVLLWGGNYAFFVPGDGGSTISLKNVYIMEGSTRYGAFRMDVVNGRRPAITKWENVRYVSMQNGKLVMGAAIPQPY